MGTLFGALSKFFDALEKLINSVDPQQTAATNDTATGTLPGTTGSEVLDTYYGLDGSEAPEMPEEMDPIAGKARIWGDPHFIGADGGKYDIQGRAGGMYNLLSDQGFQMNGRFDAWGSGGATVVGEVGIVANGNRITVEKDGDVKVNGRYLRDGQSITLGDGTEVSKKGNKVEVKSGEWDVEFQSVNSRHGKYLNMDVSTENAVADGVKPHGLLGQSFDGDGEARNGDKGRGAQGGGAIETVGGSFTEAGDKTTVGSYEVGSMHAVGEGLFSRYGPMRGGPEFSAQDLKDSYAFLTSQMAFGALTMSLLEAQFAQPSSRAWRT